MKKTRTFLFLIGALFLALASIGSVSAASPSETPIPKVPIPEDLRVKSAVLPERKELSFGQEDLTFPEKGKDKKKVTGTRGVTLTSAFSKLSYNRRVR